MGVQNGASCLYMASQYGHLEVVKYLHEVGGKELLMLTKDVSEGVVCLQGR